MLPSWDTVESSVAPVAQAGKIAQINAAYQ
jgi:hypothetical protein